MGYLEARKIGELINLYCKDTFAELQILVFDVSNKEPLIILNYLVKQLNAND